ncbi:hypothetical protein DXX93_01170 [Thalassotalea euphylliae]|uniref:Uncharacterized protein n=1 Tax=Thalassotalea euphylliae TaxID=1655234 RepID=A0A3E0TM03_9GAMM|nr:hypothetical protein [Thalassotalea euphylliae]REL25300.1 hypothetical protein DXX93_01170 [Thalassotalea euphylliae]
MSVSDQELQQKIHDLSKEVAPQRDLWPGIEKAISAQQLSPQRPQNHKGRSKVVPFAWAASLVAAVLLTWVNVAPPGISTSELSLVASLNQEFDQQKQLMLTSFGEPDLKQLPPEMQVELAKLAQARKSIAAALDNDENNTDLLNLLQWTQQQELELLKRLYTPQWQTI